MDAAKLSGVSVVKTTTKTYLVSAFCAGVVAFNLFKDLTFNDAVFAVVIVVVMCVLSILRLKQGAVKAEDLAAKKEEIVRQAITDTTADEAEAA